MSNYIYDQLHVYIVCHDASKLYGEDDPEFTGTVYHDDLTTEFTGYVGNISYIREGNEENVGTYPETINATVTNANSELIYSVIRGNFEITTNTRGL